MPQWLSRNRLQKGAWESCRDIEPCESDLVCACQWLEALTAAMARWTGTALLCVTLLQGLRMTTTLPNGAPLSACEDMMPQHSGVMPQPGPAPYTIQVSNSSYETGVPVTGKQSQRPGLGFPSLDALHPTRWAFSIQASHSAFPFIFAGNLFTFCKICAV